MLYVVFALQLLCYVSFMKVKDLPFACSASTVIRLRSSFSVSLSSETETFTNMALDHRTPHMGYL